MPSIYFKHWSNKKYAIFSSLNKVIRIATLSFVYTLLQLQPVLAQNDTTTPQMFYDLEEVESVSEVEVDIYPANLRTISTILRKQIIVSPAPSLAQLIDYYPLTDIRTRGYHDIQSDVNIQGGSFDQSIVLLNGINISDPQTGHFNLDLPLSHRQLEKLEILVGPATKTYGINEIDGKLYINSRPGETLNIDESKLPEWAKGELVTIGRGTVCVGPPSTIKTGDPNVLYKGLPVARIGDSTAHGEAITEGSDKIYINGIPAAYIGAMTVCPMVSPGPVPPIGGPIMP